MEDSTKRIIFLVKRTFTKRIRLILYLCNTLDRSSNYSNFHHVVKMQQFKLCLISEKVVPSYLKYLVSTTDFFFMKRARITGFVRKSWIIDTVFLPF